MGTKLSDKELELYRVVDEVLHYIWDPIGVSGVPQARDEYHGYLPHVFRLVQEGASQESIATYLGQVATERMGLSTNPEHDLQVASTLAKWRNVVNEKFT